jgi:hypothetical protein
VATALDQPNDADGKGAQARVKIAMLEDHPKLVAADIVIV